MNKLVFSEKIINIINKLGTNKMSILSTIEADFDYNYLDITDSNDLVSFTPTKKIKEYLESQSEIFTIYLQGTLNHSDSNDGIFKSLGYDKNKQEFWLPIRGQRGKILSEAISTSTGKTYVLFQELTKEEPRLAVINKSILRQNVDYSHLWNTSRNNIKIGRLLRILFKKSNIEFIEKDIEELVNKFKATYDFVMGLGQFKIVNGEDITSFYKKEKYTKGGGTLNGSCMAEVESNFFCIYENNPDKVSLVILYGDDGILEGDEYICNNIKGRAILWEALINSKPIKFMDRIYTVNDSDTELFKQYADKNNWYYKSQQNMEPEECIQNGKDKYKSHLIVELKNTNFDKYPFLDTMCYLSIEKGLSNREWDNNNGTLRMTNGDRNSCQSSEDVVPNAEHEETIINDDFVEIDV